MVPVNSKSTESVSNRKKQFVNFDWVHQSPLFRKQKAIIQEVKVFRRFLIAVVHSEKVKCSFFKS